MPTNLTNDRTIRTPTQVRTPRAEDGPGFGEQLNAAFKLDNVAVNLFREFNAPDPDPQVGFDPLENLRPGEEVNASRFADAESPAEMQQIREQIEREREARETLRRGSALSSVAATLGATAVDIPSLIPGLGGARALGAGGRVTARTLGRAAARGGAEGFASTAAAEGVLQSLQETRTTEESVAAAFAGLPVGAALGAGGAAGRSLAGQIARGVRGNRATRMEQAAADHAKDVFSEQLDLATRAAQNNEPGPGLRSTARQAAGADRSPEVSDEDIRLASERAISFLGRGLRKTPVTNPALEGAISEFNATRRLTARLLDGGLFTQGDFKGIFQGGPPAETRIKGRLASFLSEIQAADQEAFRQARRKLGKRNMTMDELRFRQEIGRALRRSDEPRGEIADAPEAPFIRDAAQRIRREVVNPVSNEAVNVGLLSSDITPDTASSFFTRVFSKEAINANRPEFKRRLKAHFASLLGEDFDRDEGVSAAAGRRAAERRAEDAEAGADAEEGPDPETINEQTDSGLRDPFTGEPLTVPENADLEEIADEVTNKILGSNSGASQEIIANLPTGERGSLKARTLSVPDELVEDFLEDDPEIALRNFINTTVPDIELQRALFRPEVEPQFRRDATPQELEQAREAELEPFKRAEGEARSRVANLKKDMRSRRLLSDEQVAARNDMVRAVRQTQRLPDQVKVSVLDRIDDDPLVMFDDDFIKYVRHMEGEVPEGETGLADFLAKRQKSLTDEQKQQRQRLVQAQRDYAEAKQQRVEKEQEVGAGVVANNRLREAQGLIESRINEEANERIEATTDPNEASRLRDRARKDIAMLQRTIERLRGENVSDPRFDGLRAASSAARDLNFARLAGSVVLSSIPDLGKVAVEEGFSRMVGEATRGLMRGVRRTAPEISSRDAERFGVALNRAMNTVAEQRFLGDDPITGRSQIVRQGTAESIQRKSRAASNFVAKVSGINWWANTMQRAASRLATDSALRAARKLAQGSKLSRRDRTKLVRSFASEALAERIGIQAERFGKVEDGLLTANVDEWTDAGAAEALRDGMRREVDNMILQPGVGDVPLWTGTGIGRVVSQFKKFAMASINRILLGSVGQRALGLKDAQALGGLSAMIGLGAASVLMRDLAIDGKVDDRSPRQLITEAVDRSGIAFALFETDSLAEKFTGMSLQRALAGEELQRFQRRGPLEQLGGPVFGFVNADIPRAVDATLTDETFSQEQVRDIMRLMPGQNLFFLRALKDGAISQLPEEDDSG